MPDPAAPIFRRDLFVYLAGPLTATAEYSAEVNVAQARGVFLALMRAGIASFCPHLIGGADDASYEQWLAYDFAVLDRCTHLMLLPRWETSPGARREHLYARARGIPIVQAGDPW